jgi:hypothetical protein
MEKTEHFINASPTGRVLNAVEFDASGRVAFFSVHEAEAERAKTLLQSVGQTIVTQSIAKGQIVLVTQGLDKTTLLSTLSAQGQSFEAPPKEKQGLLQFLKKEGWKLRGGSSVVGQSLTLFSAARSLPTTKILAGERVPKFDPATGAFAVLNLAANFINWIFGGQKEEDKFGLQKFDNLIADEINRYQPGTEHHVSVDEVRKVSYMTKQERIEHDKERSPLGMLQKNSVRLGEVGLRTAGSIFLMFDYTKLPAAARELTSGKFKSAFTTAKTSGNLFIAGCGMVIGKILGLFAETYDPNNPPKDYWSELRQKVFWTASSWTEMFSQGFLAYDRFANRKLIMGDKVMTDYAGGFGNILLTVPPYPTRLVLPYGEKVLDVDEIQARLLDELPKLPKEKIPEVVARVSVQMHEHMGEKSPGFAKLYSNVMEKLEKHHHIICDPVPAKPQPRIQGESVQREASKDAAHAPLVPL